MSSRNDSNVGVNIYNKKVFKGVGSVSGIEKKKYTCGKKKRHS